MATYTMGSVALVGTNRSGDIKPDEKGWYDVYLGALNFPNSVGAEYDVEPVRQLLMNDSIIARRIAKGRLFGELGHPRQLPGMTDKEYIARLLDLNEQCEVFTIKTITIDTSAKDKHGRPIIALRGLIKPSGPYRDVLQQKLDDPDINVNFSIRTLAQNYYQNGKLRKRVGNFITVDLVGEPGIDVADKYNAPSTESYLVEVDGDTILSVAQNARSYGLESSKDAMRDIVSFVNETSHVNNNLQKPTLMKNVPAWVGKY